MSHSQAFPNDARAGSIGQGHHKGTPATSADRAATLPMKASHRKRMKRSTVARHLFASTMLWPLCVIPCFLAATYGMTQNSALAATPDTSLIPAANPTAPTASPGDNSNAVANTAFVQAAVTQLAQAAGFYYGNFIYYSPFPSLPDPTDSSAVPSGWASSDTGNLANKLSLVFGSANPASPNCPACLITNRVQLDQHVEHNQIDGLAGVNIDGQAKDVNPGGFTATFRSYPAGDPHDTTVVGSDALYFHAFCAGTFGSVCQGPGNIVTGIVRPETWVVPGDIVETCMQRPGVPAAAAWLTTWLYGGGYPAAGTVPAYYGSSIYPTRPTNSVETDNPDGFPLKDGVAANYDLTPGAPGDPTIQNTAPVFVAANGGFTPDGVTSTFLHTKIDLSAAMHCYQVELVPTVYSDPQTNTAVGKHGHVVYYLDGVEYEDMQFDWNTGPELSWNGIPTGAAVAPASLMVALQYAPTWTPTANAAMTPATVSGAVAKLASIRIWHRTAGAHVAPTLANAVVPPPPPIVPAITLTAPSSVTPLGIAIVNGTYSSSANLYNLTYSIDGGPYSPVMMLDSFTNTSFEVSLPPGSFPTGVHTLTLKNGSGLTSAAVSVTAVAAVVSTPGSIDYAQAQNVTNSSIEISMSGTSTGGAVRRYVYQIQPYGTDAWNTCSLSTYHDQVCSNLTTNTHYNIQVYGENEAGAGPIYSIFDVKTP